MKQYTYTADWIVPVSSRPIKNGAIIVENGVIKKVCHITEVPEKVQIKKIKGTILPGLINAHTHLELSGLSGKTSSTHRGLSDWLRSLKKLLEKYDHTQNLNTNSTSLGLVVGMGLAHLHPFAGKVNPFTK